MSHERDLVLTPRQQAAKAAFRDLVDAFGGQVAAAAETGRSQSRICAYGHRNMADFAPVDVVECLESRTDGTAGHPHVTRWLARQQGYGLVRLPDPGANATSWGLLASRLAKEGGDLTSGICADLADDNDVSPAEARARLRDAAELVRVAVELEHALKLRAADDGAAIGGAAIGGRGG
jgi:hypothetical protein